MAPLRGIDEAHCRIDGQKRPSRTDRNDSRPRVEISRTA